MIRDSLRKAFEYNENLAQAIYESSALYFGHTLLGKKNGDVPAKLVFVSDVPEVHAGAETGIPFADPTLFAGKKIIAEDENPPDSSPTARRFWQFAKPLGLKMPDAKNGWHNQRAYFAYLMARHPSTLDRAHRSPTGTEIKIALQLLQAQLYLTQPRLLVTLGSAPTRAVTKLLRLKELPEVGKPLDAQADWGPVTIMALAHPRPKERLHRPDWQQKADWKKLAQLKKKLR